ncbi:hypothetical protein IQ243_05990 [Nostocales cyanobacterium LEGE 11386]|nr:hypothetical protein [Nostocales cyanobacterium LEGE 11386]
MSDFSIYQPFSLSNTANPILPVLPLPTSPSVPNMPRNSPPPMLILPQSSQLMI